MQNMQKQICKKYAKYACNMQVLMILPYIACNMHDMQKNMHDMQNMQTSLSICRICTAHFADGSRWSCDRAIMIISLAVPDVASPEPQRLLRSNVA
jgi:hypothetical protein